MENSNSHEFRNMLIQAQKESLEAKHLAEIAMAQVTAHEKLCSVRYENIANQLKSLPDIYTVINNLSRTANRAVGMGMALTVLSILLGSLYTIMKLSQGN